MPREYTPDFVTLGNPEAARPDIAGILIGRTQPDGYLTLFVSTIQPRVGDPLTLLSEDGTDMVQFTNGLIDFNVDAADIDIRFRGDDDINLLTLNAGDDTIGIGRPLSGHLAKLHIDQDVPGANLPVLHLQQADVDEPFIVFEGDAANGDLTRDLVAEADVAVATRIGFHKVEVCDDGDQIVDADYFVPMYSLA